MTCDKSCFCFCQGNWPASHLAAGLKRHLSALFFFLLSSSSSSLFLTNLFVTVKQANKRRYALALHNSLHCLQTDCCHQNAWWVLSLSSLLWCWFTLVAIQLAALVLLKTIFFTSFVSSFLYLTIHIQLFTLSPHISATPWIHNRRKQGVNTPTCNRTSSAVFTFFALRLNKLAFFPRRSPNALLTTTSQTSLAYSIRRSPPRSSAMIVLRHSTHWYKRAMMPWLVCKSQCKHLWDLGEVW